MSAPAPDNWNPRPKQPTRSCVDASGSILVAGPALRVGLSGVPSGASVLGGGVVRTFCASSASSSSSSSSSVSNSLETDCLGLRRPGGYVHYRYTDSRYFLYIQSPPGVTSGRCIVSCFCDDSRHSPLASLVRRWKARREAQPSPAQPSTV